MSGVQEERGEEMAQRSPFSPVFGPHPVSNTVPDSIQQQQPQAEQYTLPPSVIDNPEGGFLPIQTELERLKLESERVSINRLRMELENREKEREHEYKMALLNLSNPQGVTLPATNINHSSVMPIFCEENVASFFTLFEEVATGMKWPSSQWCFLLGTALKGRAQSLFVSASPAVRSDYNQLKSLILRGYRLHPEAYRQKFRTNHKKSEQTHVEFAREMSTNFDHWIETEKVTNFHSLRQLVLMENFLWKIDLPVADHLRTHRKWGSLEEAADEADGYVLTHEFVGRRTPFQNKFKDNLKHRSDNSDIKSNPVLLKNQEGPGESQRGRSGNFGRGPCTYCNKPGHTESACWTKARDLRRQTSSVNAVASFRDTSPETESPETESESVACVAPRVGVKNALVTDVTGRVDSTVRDFGPFLSVGTVKVGGEEETLTAPKLRETAASVPHAEDDVDLHLTELFTPPTQETSSPPPPHCPAGLKDLQQADDDCKRLADVALSEDECEHGSTRLCIDYRRVNSLTRSDTFPLPRVDDCIDQGGGVTRDVLKQSFRSESWGLIWIGNGTSRCLASVSLSSRLPGRLDFLPASVLHSGPSWTVLFSIIIILLPSWARQTVFLS
ncbi:hypothetical protein Pcinc_012036 [Petrolisthes cinctipes]|uniref:Uncharacterized protein n=1 Tax=Petrolisthes cinctipes TaxID=88211 RepID=A0AAE1KTX5_PETCI|nr:hypothetical protein Pcinc_012036 [Petrolisthes cinctipes]